MRSIRVRTWILLALLAIVINPFSYMEASTRTFRFQEARTGSMEPTIPVGHWFMLNALAYRSSEPARGDVVGVATTINGESRGVTKRIVGLPGEKVQLYGGLVYIDDVPLDERYLDQPAATWDDWPVHLGPNEYFVLGDNRRNSLDSRDFGPVQRSGINSRMDASGPGFRSGEFTPAVVGALLDTTTFMLVLSIGHLIAGCLLVWRRRHSQWWAIPAFLGWGAWFAVLWIVLRPRTAEEVERKPVLSEQGTAKAGTEAVIVSSPIKVSEIVHPLIMGFLTFAAFSSALAVPALLLGAVGTAFAAICLSVGAAFGITRFVSAFFFGQSILCVLSYAAGELMGLEPRHAAVLALISILAPLVLNNAAWRIRGSRPTAAMDVNWLDFALAHFIWFGAATIYVQLGPTLMALVFGAATVVLFFEQLLLKPGSAPYVAVLGGLGVASILAGGPWLLTTQLVLPFAMLILLVRDVEHIQLRHASATEAEPQPAT